MIQTFLPVRTAYGQILGLLGLGTFQNFSGTETTLSVAGRTVNLQRVTYYPDVDYMSVTLTTSSLNSPQTADLPNYFPITDFFLGTPTNWTMLPGAIPNDASIDQGFLTRFFTSGGIPPATILPHVPIAVSFSSSQASLTVSVQDTSTIPSPVSWLWDFGDSYLDSNQNPPPHTYLSSGTYTVRLTVTDSSSNLYTTQKVITVPSASTVATSRKNWDLIANVADAASCSTFDIPFTHDQNLFLSSSTAVNLSIDGTPPLSYLILRPFLITDSGFPTYSASKGNKLRFVKMSAPPITTGLYVYTLQATFADGSVEFVQLNLTIANLAPSPPPFSLSFTYVLTGLDILLTNTSNRLNEYLSTFWIVDGLTVSSSNGTIPTPYTFPAAGTYSVQVGGLTQSHIVLTSTPVSITVI